MLLLLLSLLALTHTASSFLIIDAEPGLVVVEPGQTVRLSCVVDSHYEYCMWHSPADTICDFEWKRSEDNITMQDCPLNDNHEKVGHHFHSVSTIIIINVPSRYHSTGSTMINNVEFLSLQQRKTLEFGSKSPLYIRYIEM